jgi:hypothetical protein
VDDSDKSFRSSKDAVSSSLKVLLGVLGEDKINLDLVTSLLKVVHRIDPENAGLIPTLSWNRFADAAFLLGNSISAEQTSNADRPLSTFTPQLQVIVGEGLIALEASAFPLALGLAFPEQSAAASKIALESIHQVKDKAEAALAELSSMVERGHPLVRKLALDANSSAYAEHGRTQTIAAWSWRLLTLACLGLVGFLGWTAIDVVDASPQASSQLSSREWASIVTHLVVSSAITGIAIFAAKQAAWHRRHSAEAKDMVLRLATVEPFLDEFPADKRLDLLTTLAVPLFASPNLSVGPVNDDGASDSSATLKLMELLISKKP